MGGRGPAHAARIQSQGKGAHGGNRPFPPWDALSPELQALGTKGISLYLTPKSAVTIVTSRPW